MAKLFKFYGGENRTMSLRLMTLVNGERVSFSIPLGSVITVRLDASGKNNLGVEVIEITKDSNGNGVEIVNYDRGELKLTLDDQDTTLMRTGDIIIEIVSGSVTRKARIAQGVKKLSL